MKPALSVRQLTVALPDGAEVLSSVDLEVSPGECLAVIGASGAGKSVLARTFLGLTLRERGWNVTAEEFTLGDHSMMHAGEQAWRAVRGRQIGLVLQDALQSLDPLRTLEAEVGETLAAHRELVPGANTTRARRPHVVRALERAGLSDATERLHQRSGQLSGGQRQRALIASALIGTAFARSTAPGVLIADEPTTALDPETAAHVLELLREVRDAGTAIVLVTHDLSVVRAIADRVAVLDGGRIVEAKPLRDLLDSPESSATRALLEAEPRGEKPGGTVTPGSRELVTLTDVTRTFRVGGRDIRPLDAFSLTIHEREAIGVVGPSGAGKTTLARLIAGADRPDSGTIKRSSRANTELVRVRLVPQDPLGTFDPRWNVAQVINEALVDRAPARRTRATSSPGEARAAAVRDLLTQVDLAPELADRLPQTLSGGQRQRVAIARALAADPDLLVCDEPVSALDMSTQAGILALFRRLQRERGLALVFISHDLAAVRQVADRIVRVG